MGNDVCTGRRRRGAREYMIRLQEVGGGVCDSGIKAVVRQNDVYCARGVHGDSQHLEASVVWYAE